MLHIFAREKGDMETVAQGQKIHIRHYDWLFIHLARLPAILLAIWAGLSSVNVCAYVPDACAPLLIPPCIEVRDYTWGLDLAGLQSGIWSQESGGIGGLLAITEVTGASTNILLPICDHVGTVHALVAVVTNNVVLEAPCVVETRTYSPYGELLEVDRPLPTANCPLFTAHSASKASTTIPRPASGTTATATTTPSRPSG